MDGFVEFEFDLPDALLKSLIKVLDGMHGAPLLPPALENIPDAQGVYQLLLNGEIVYIGKTDSEAGLRKRLDRHAATIQHRCNLDPSKVTFKGVRVFVFTAIDLETQLIQHYGNSVRVPWNFSGFGSNDPGRERDTTNIKPEGFDAQFPIDLDRRVEMQFPDTCTAAAALTALKEALPYTFRIEAAVRGSRKMHPELVSAQVNIPAGPHTTRSIVELVVGQLPEGWQATALAGRIILYREARDYPFGTVIARS